MSKCCEKKVFKCEDMDGVGKIFVRTNAVLKAEAPIRFKTDSGYVQETTFEKSVDITIDEAAIKVDLSKYPTKEDVDNDISLAKDNVKSWVENNYPTKEELSGELSGVNEYIESGLTAVKQETQDWANGIFLKQTEAEKTYLKKSESTSGNIEYINKTYFDVSASDTHLDTGNGLRISFKKYIESAQFSFQENDNDSKHGFSGLYGHGTYGSSGTTFEYISTMLNAGEIWYTYLNGIVETSKGVYKVILIFDNLGRTKFSISGTVEKVK